MVSATRYRRSVTRGRARRGAIVVLVVLLLLSMVGFAALAIDFGRLDNLKADLQTSADAAALAGAVELITSGGHNGFVASNVATAWAGKNPAMQATVTVVTSRCGVWFDWLPTFSPWLGGTCVPILTNAVEVTVSRQSSGLFMSALGVTAPNLRATARAAVLPDPVTCLPNCRVYLIP